MEFKKFRVLFERFGPFRSLEIEKSERVSYDRRSEAAKGMKIFFFLYSWIDFALPQWRVLAFSCFSSLSLLSGVAPSQQRADAIRHGH